MKFETFSPPSAVEKVDVREEAPDRRLRPVEGRKVHRGLRTGRTVAALGAALVAIGIAGQAEAQGLGRSEKDPTKRERMQQVAPVLLREYLARVKDGTIPAGRGKEGVSYASRGRIAVNTLALKLVREANGMNGTAEVSPEQVQEAIAALGGAYRSHLRGLAAQRYPGLNPLEQAEHLRGGFARPGEDAEETALELFGAGMTELGNMPSEGLLYLAYIASVRDKR